MFNIYVNNDASINNNLIVKNNLDVSNNITSYNFNIENEDTSQINIKIIDFDLMETEWNTNKEKKTVFSKDINCLIGMVMVIESFGKISFDDEMDYIEKFYSKKGLKDSYFENF